MHTGASFRFGPRRRVAHLVEQHLSAATGTTSAGDNYRMTNLRAAIGVAQVEKLSGFLERQRHRAARRPPGSSSSSPMLLGEELFWLFSVFLADNRVTRDQAWARLSAADMTRPFFHSVHRLPPYEAPPASFRRLAPRRPQG